MNKVKHINVVNEQDEVIKHLPIGVDAINVDLEDGQNAEEVFVDLQDKIKKKSYYFDNVEKMKNANLKEGDCCITLGYYEANDGGGATYRIVHNVDLKDDDGKVLKLNNELKAKLIIKDNINVKQFGARGDGTTDDLKILQKVNDSFENTTVFIPKGVYCISNTFYISNNNNLIGDNAEIKAISDMDYLLVYNKESITGTYQKTFKKYIRDLTLNGNYLVNQAVLTMQGVLGFDVENLKILNFNLYGVQTKIPGTYVNEAIFKDLYIRNNKPVLGTVGINNNANDCKFENIIIRDVQNGIITNTGYFDYIHGWNGYKDLVPGSFFVKSINHSNILSNCYADTYQYSFISTFQSLNIANAFIYNNKNIYDSEMQAEYPPVLFESEVDTFGTNQYGYFNVINSQIHTTNFDDVQLTNRYHGNNNFKDNWFSNLGKVSNKQFMRSSNTGYGFSGDVNTMFVPGTYSMNNNDSLPGTFKYGILTVKTITPNAGAYITTNHVENVNFCEQIFVTSEGYPKMYIRMYSNGAWSNWQKVTTTNIE